MSTYKISLIGKSGSGKSSFIKRLFHDIFQEEHFPTLGVEIHIHRLDGDCFNFWDIAGDEKYWVFASSYCLRSQACLLFLTSEDCHEASQWEKNYRDNGGKGPIIYVINKIDEKPLTPEQRSLFNDKPYVEISLKKNANVYEVIDVLRQELKKN